jgi:hypothetical protein
MEPIGLETQERSGSPRKWRVVALASIVVIVGLAIVRSSITTSLDSFTYDEAYHIGAGVAYVKTGDFRLNPEHPPLVKLWVGAYLSMLGYNMSPFRKLADKVDERQFLEDDVYNKNDHDVVQARARTAMFALNGLLLFGFALSVWRVFDGVMATAATAFLAIDPTVAAHMPVVMTDLPVALLSGTAILLAIHAFRTWRILDLILAAAALGLCLSSKHSAILTFIVIAAVGIVIALFLPRSKPVTRRIRRLPLVGIVLVGAIVVLWSTYFFQYYESPMTKEDQFNRALAEKITDVRSPVYRAGLTLMADGYLFPRSYTWGMADTIRAGAEGRIGDAFVMGKLYYGSAPWFFAPLMITVKLPLGLMLLVIVGTGFLIARRVPAEFLAPIAGLALLSAIVIFFVARGSSYGGIRHLLAVYPLLAILAALVVHYRSRVVSHSTGVVLAAGLITSLVLAVPVMRPWEYFNEIAGGTANAHKYFDGEGIDLYQRGNELRRYYHEVLKPRDVLPYVFYLIPDIDDPSKTFDRVRRSGERDRGKWDGPYATGIFITGANEISPTWAWDKKSFREAEPIARFGNLFVFEGTFDIRPMRAQGLSHYAMFRIYGPEPNIEEAVAMLSESFALDPRAFFVALELGNQYLKLGRRDEALKAYQDAFDNCRPEDSNKELLLKQVDMIKNADSLEGIQPLRNPALE